jgi:ribonuclease HI
MDVVVFTDGSSSYNKNKKGRIGGYGVYFEDEQFHKYNGSKIMTGDNPTNQRAELTACIAAIKKFKYIVKKNNTIEKLIIYSDSMYVINTITIWAHKWKLNGWVRKNNKICNLDLVKKLYKLSQDNLVEYNHVKAHRKEPSNSNTLGWKLWYGNKMADNLAKSY